MIDVTCEAYRTDEAMFYCDGRRLFGCVDTHWDLTIALRWVLAEEEGTDNTVHPQDWPTATALDWQHWVNIP